MQWRGDAVQADPQRLIRCTFINYFTTYKYIIPFGKEISRYLLLFCMIYCSFPYGDILMHFHQLNKTLDCFRNAPNNLCVYCIIFNFFNHLPFQFHMSYWSYYFSLFTLLGLICRTIAALNSCQMQTINLSLYISLSRQVLMPTHLL